MRKLAVILVALAIMPAMVNADGSRTLVLADLAGEWRPARGYDRTTPPIEEFEQDEIALVFDEQHRAHMTRRFADGRIETYVSGPLSQSGQTFHWRFDTERGLGYELVLAGWSIDRVGQRLFGYLYLFGSEPGLFNGWGVDVMPRNDS